MWEEEHCFTSLQVSLKPSLMRALGSHLLLHCLFCYIVLIGDSPGSADHTTP